MTINLTQLIADREAGTDGPWSYNSSGEFGETVDDPKGYSVVSAKWLGGSQVDLDINPTDARRIARVPELEAAFLYAVETMGRIAAEAYVSIDEGYPMSWRGVAVERIDIARRFLERFK